MYAGSTKAPHEAGFDAYCVGYGKGSAPMRDGYSINIYILRSVFHFSFPATDTFGCNERCRVSYHTITCNSYTHHTLTGALTPTTHTHAHTQELSRPPSSPEAVFQTGGAIHKQSESHQGTHQLHREYTIPCIAIATIQRRYNKIQLTCIKMQCLHVDSAVRIEIPLYNTHNVINDVMDVIISLATISASNSPVIPP